MASLGPGLLSVRATAAGTAGTGGNKRFRGRGRSHTEDQREVKIRKTYQNIIISDPKSCTAAATYACSG